ncbi:biotin/lipoate--protein ligase family protein [Puniceibacterium sp. IMCC21224]|uniref:biotin/lipoate--protein ligase family protein n=1 Tax=Puniceibacterium sp. IMCC21224 TaxID=1618204 RepID=UPI00064E0869|nr:biotin/lipoate--protein ligase family protein [Puniceibacterium sp. IMCC21224]KMK65758.1 biotin-(acetyl-CoA carboxylase) ligase [Puniceibacterium sp. IMCC21224]
MTTAPQFPPLLSGLHSAGHDPFDAACQTARTGCDAGLILYDAGPDLRAAIILAPEVPLAQAVAMLPLCAVGLQNALGALAPPELPVHLEWGGAVRANGGRCGGFRIAASTNDPDAVPDWLVTGFELRFQPAPGDAGEHPDETALHAEGCGDLEPLALLESWSRHTLNGLNRWDVDGIAPLHREWSGLAHGLGQPMTFKGQSGTFLGVDEALGLLLKSGKDTRLIPLTALLEQY